MSERHTWHVTPHEADGWQVKKANSEKATSRHENKADAIEAAKRHAKSKQLGQVKVHKTDGTIHEEFTYGEDPPETKG